MTTPLTVAASACYRIVQEFLHSDPDVPLSKTPVEDIPESIRRKHISLLHNTTTLYPTCLDSKLHRYTQEVVRQTYTDTLAVLQEWPLDKLSISYNGGKDCLVLLIIYLAAIHESKQLLNDEEKKIHAVYVNTETEFAEHMQFLESSVIQYGLNFTAVFTSASTPTQQTLTERPGSISCLYSPTTSLPCGFHRYLTAEPGISAIIVGIRRTDPWGSTLRLQQPTDSDRGWPDFVRVHPILDWHTNEIWYFLKWAELSSANSSFNVTYCPLYDAGYTSLGGSDNTVRNPQLRRETDDDDTDTESYWPAWCVLEDDIERLSRVQKGKV